MMEGGEAREGGRGGSSQGRRELAGGEEARPLDGGRSLRGRRELVGGGEATGRRQELVGGNATSAEKVRRERRRKGREARLG